jgi:AraC family transcriptional regulator
MALSDVSAGGLSHCHVTPFPGTRRRQRSAVVTRLRRSWSGADVEVLEIYGPGQHLENLHSRRHRLIAMLEEVGGRAEIRPSRIERSLASRKAHNQLALIAPGMAAWECAEEFRYIRRVAIEFDGAALASHYPKLPEIGSSLSSIASFTSSRIWTLADLLADECVRPDPYCQRYCDGLVLALFHNLLLVNGAMPCRQRARGLSPGQLQRVTEYIERHVVRAIQLKDLAEMIGLSPSHFGRAFRVSTGMAPHRWHLVARVRRTQQSLLTSGDSLADIAVANGFADQSHFTRSFRSIIGETPGAWRQRRTA